jgi:dephospho-CoA kinase
MDHPPSSAPRPALRRIGLTGGIGAGKSTVAALWREQGVRVIDLDASSRAVLDVPGPGLEEAIARLVFADAGARADLERIVLRRVEQATAVEEEQARAAGEDLVVHDSPLLLEKHHDQIYASVVVVLARHEDRIRRVVRTRGKDRAYVTSVMGAQVSDLERIRRADRLILNNGDPEQLRERALRELDRLRTAPVRTTS